jgi:hypothetical protein
VQGGRLASDFLRALAGDLGVGTSFAVDPGIGEVVVRALYVETEVDDGPERPEHVLPVNRVRSSLSRFAGQPEFSLPEAEIGRGEQRPLMIESFEGIESSGACPIPTPAVGPVVVAGNPNERPLERVEEIE